MAELKKSTSKYFSPNEVRRILLEVEVRCQIKGNNLPLDQAIGEFRKRVRTREATEHLQS